MAALTSDNINADAVGASLAGAGGLVLMRRYIVDGGRWCWGWFRRHKRQHEQLVEMILAHTKCRIETAADYKEMKKEIAATKLDAGIARANTEAILALMKGTKNERTITPRKSVARGKAIKRSA